MSKIIDISQIDKNFQGAEINEPDILYLNVKFEPFELYGFYDAKGQEDFKRLPDEVAEATSKGVVSLYKNTAGGRVRFRTDSPYVAIRALHPSITEFSHMTHMGVRGFDMYIDDPESGTSSFYTSFIPPRIIEDGYQGIVKFPDSRMRYITLNFPLYNDVSDLFIGVSKDALMGKGAKYRNQKPVVYYGSSITQGGCASRPGNCYQNMITRRLNIDYLNLGFSGSGKAEDAIVDYMAGLDMSVFVSDYDHNAPTPEYLEATHHKMYEKIRGRHPHIPYVMISRPDFHKPKPSGMEDSTARRQVILNSYNKARAKGDLNVYFIDGESFFLGEFKDSCTVDGCHPNDLGFSKMATVIGDLLSKLDIE